MVLIPPEEIITLYTECAICVAFPAHGGIKGD